MGAIRFANLNFNGLTRKDVLSSDEKFKIIVTANAEIIVKANEDPEYKRVLEKSVKTLDGRVPHLLASFFNKDIKIEKISGSDFIYDISRMAEKNNERIFLLGAEQGINEKASKKLSERYKIAVGGYSPEYRDYPFEKNFNDNILKRIELFKPQYIFVALGSGKQEKWLYDNRDFLEKLGVKIGVGCGGTLDFVAGKVKRAPRWIQKVGLEGIFRFLVEPKWYRFKRILVSFKLFKYI